MFEQVERASRLQHAQNFAEAAQGILNRAEDQRNDDAVKGSVSERQAFGGGLREMNGDARSPEMIVGITQHGGIRLGRLDALDPGWIVVGEVQTVASADFQDDARGLARRFLTQGPHEVAFGYTAKQRFVKRGKDGMVNPRSLIAILDLAHHFSH